MRKGLFLVVVMAVVFNISAPLFAQNKDLQKDQIIDIATAAVKAKGIAVSEVDVIYDEGGKLWNERLGVAVAEDKSPNYGILKEGFLKNYKIVYFDFKEPIKDVWVFIDKDTGEVLTVYQEQ